MTPASTSHPPTKGPAARRNAHEPRPCTDRAPSILLADRRRKQGQAARHEQGGSDSLEGSGRDEGLGRRSNPTQGGRHRERTDADHEDATTPVLVAERASEEQEGGEGHEVGVEHPLQVGEIGVQVHGDRGERDVHDRAVEEGHPGAKDRRQEGPPRDRRPPALHNSERYRAIQ